MTLSSSAVPPCLLCHQPYSTGPLHFCQPPAAPAPSPCPTRGQVLRDRRKGQGYVGTVHEDAVVAAAVAWTEAVDAWVRMGVGAGEGLQALGRLRSAVDAYQRWEQAVRERDIAAQRWHAAERESAEWRTVAEQAQRIVDHESIACAYCSFELPAPAEVAGVQLHVLVCEFNPLGIRWRETSGQAEKLINIVRHIIRHDLLGQADQERLALEDAAARLAALLAADTEGDQ